MTLYYFKTRLGFSIALFLVVMLSLGFASAINLDSCTNITQSGTYALTKNVNSNGTCMRILSNNVILDCQNKVITGILNPINYGIEIASVNNVTIKKCIINKFTIGISAWGNNLTITENQIFNSNDYGIALQGARDSRVFKNKIKNGHTNAGDCIVTRCFYGWNYVYDNNLTDCAFGISNEGTNNLKVYNNRINNTMFGIHITTGNNTLSENNTITSSQYAFYLWNSYRNQIMGNIITRNSIGIQILDAKSNFIYNNYFMNDQNFDLTSSNNSFSIVKRKGKNIINQAWIGGNYWANYQGTGYSQTCQDRNNDGFCDDSYRLNDNNQDNLPLKKISMPQIAID